MKNALKILFSRIEFWIIIFFLIRLIGITNPPLEKSNNWRQVTGLMVARNFLEVDANILYPRVDDNKARTGIIGMEFPSQNYLHFLFAKLFGYQHWFGRLINLIISSFGLWYFYKIARKFYGHQHAFAATLCLIGSSWFCYSRKMMPDTYCIALMFIGVYYCVKYLEKEKIYLLLAGIFFISLALLSKIPAAIYLAVFVPLLLSDYKRKTRIILATSLIFPVVSTYTWYFVWNPYLSTKYGYWYNIGDPLGKSFLGLMANFNLVLERFYFSAFNSFIMFGVFMAGLFLMIKKADKKFYLPVLSVILVFALYILKSGYYFYTQPYYIIPFVPVMALVAGYALTFIINKKFYILLFTAAIFESIANQQNDFFTPKSEVYKLQLPVIANKISNKNDLIVINSNGNPQQLYLSHRKGWNCEDYQLTDTLFMKDLAQNGCKFIFVNKRNANPEIAKRKLYEDENFIVYRMN